MNAIRQLRAAVCFFSALIMISVAGALDANVAEGKDEATTKDESFSTKGKLDEVTVYRGQALVTRLVEVPGPTRITRSGCNRTAGVRAAG